MARGNHGEVGLHRPEAAGDPFSPPGSPRSKWRRARDKARRGQSARAGERAAAPPTARVLCGGGGSAGGPRGAAGGRC